MITKGRKVLTKKPPKVGSKVFYRGKWFWVNAVWREKEGYGVRLVGKGETIEQTKTPWWKFWKQEK